MPLAAEGIPHHEVYFWTIECRLADDRLVLNALGVYSGAQGALGLFPDFVAADVIFFLLRIAQRKSDPVVLESIGIEDLERQVKCSIKLFLDLVRAQEDVRVILRQTAHACQSRQCTGFLIAIERGELGVAHGQLAIAVHLRLIQRDMVRAVHWLQHIGIVF